jgi:hypothetical protein
LLLVSAREVSAAGDELFERPREQVIFRERILELALHVEKIQRERYKGKRIGVEDFEIACDFTLDAEIQLAKAKRVAKKLPDR